jgi:CBS domain containing-hemolysin-like protein
MFTNQNLIVLQDIIRPAYFVPETKKITNLLREFQRQRLQVAIVLDEFGGTAGIVTLEDIIEELVGEIQDEYDQEIPAVQKVKDGIFSVQANAAITDANEFLPFELPENKDYDTVGGLVNFYFERIPNVNESIDIDNYKLTVTQKSRQSVEVVRLDVVRTREASE